jgi:hypothetical protein
MQSVYGASNNKKSADVEDERTRNKDETNCPMWFTARGQLAKQNIHVLT